METKNTFALNLNGILSHAEGLLKNVKTGVGMNLTKEQKEEYDRKVNTPEFKKNMKDAEAKIKSLKAEVLKANQNGANNPTTK